MRRDAASICAGSVVGRSRVLLYVDGAAFHVGKRLRRDRLVRGRLREGGWTVVELRAADLRRGGAVVGEIRAQIPDGSGLV